MRFKVPQFLEIEDKIFGPFTFRQFVYMAGGAGLCFVLYRLVGFLWSAIPIMAIAGFALMLAFFRPNDKPFINMVESWLKYVTQNKLYIWERRKIKPGDKKNTVQPENPAVMMYQNNGRLTGSKLRDLAWSLDVMDANKNQN